MWCLYSTNEKILFQEQYLTSYSICRTFSSPTLYVSGIITNCGCKNNKSQKKSVWCLYSTNERFYFRNNTYLAI